MHHLDLGLFKYMIQFTQVLLSQEGGQNSIDQFDNRLAKIPPFKELKIFKNGLYDMSRITAAEYRNLMKIMVFVLDNILPTDAKKKKKKLSNLYVSWNEMYIFSRKDSFNESELTEFEVCLLIANIKRICLMNI